MKAIKKQNPKSATTPTMRYSEAFRPTANGSEVPLDIRKALAANPKAKALWEDITPIARRDWIYWIISGKRAETRTIRIEKAISKLSSGKRRACCFEGTKWLIKNS